MLNDKVKTEVICGDCIAVMDSLPAASVEAIVTDPPYGISMMGKQWDHSVPGIPFWESALRVAKPGAYLLAMGSPRKFHRLAVNIEDAGWELRNTIMWVYGHGFPKSVSVGKQIDKKMGVECEVVGLNPNHRPNSPKDNTTGDFNPNTPNNAVITKPSSPQGIHWDGWGSDLKPAHEPILMFRKPLKGSIADNVLQYGCGAINIDACRIPITQNGDSNYRKPRVAALNDSVIFEKNSCKIHGSVTDKYKLGRFPANFCHDGSDEVLELFPHADKSIRSMRGIRHSGRHGGSAARFFYCAKPSTAERELGCETLAADGVRKNDHISVKPLALMRYLVKMVCPVGSTVLDPFAGSGTTGMAAQHEGVNSILIDIDQHYCDIARARNG